MSFYRHIREKMPIFFVMEDNIYLLKFRPFSDENAWKYKNLYFRKIPGNSRGNLEKTKFPGIPVRQFPVALLETYLYYLNRAYCLTQCSSLGPLLV